MGEKSQINILVGEEQKEEWKEYVEESRSETSLTSLILTSVENNIASGDGAQTSSSPALERDIDTLRGELSRVRKDVSWIRNQLQDDRDISGLAQEVYDELVVLPTPKETHNIPDGMDATEYQRRMGAQMVITPDDMNEWEAEEKSLQTVSAIAERLDAEVKRVEDALKHLQDQFLPVVEVEFDGEIHYFKEE